MRRNVPRIGVNIGFRLDGEASLVEHRFIGISNFHRYDGLARFLRRAGRSGFLPHYDGVVFSGDGKRS